MEKKTQKWFFFGLCLGVLLFLVMGRLVWGPLLYIGSVLFVFLFVGGFIVGIRFLLVKGVYTQMTSSAVQFQQDAHAETLRGVIPVGLWCLGLIFILGGLGGKYFEEIGKREFQTYVFIGSFFVVVGTLHWLVRKRTARIILQVDARRFVLESRVAMGVVILFSIGYSFIPSRFALSTPVVIVFGLLLVAAVVFLTKFANGIFLKKEKREGQTKENKLQ